MKIRRILFRLMAVSGCLIALLFISSPVLAVEEPSDTPTVSNIKVNRHLLEDDDVLIYGDYNIPYTSPPSTGADETYMFVLMDGENTIGTMVPFTLMDNGYNKGVFSFYFTAADNLTWGVAYTIRISQNPAQFESPDYWDYSVSTSAYTSADTQETNQALLAGNVIAAAQRLESYFTDYTFLDSTAGGTVLSSPTGETYFRGAIYGIQAMAPDLFLVQTLNITLTSENRTTAQFDIYGNRLSDTWVGESENATATQFGVTTSAVFGFLFILPLCIGAVIVSSMKFARAEPGFIVAALFILLGGLMGWVSCAIFASTYQLFAIYLAYVWFYARG